MAVFDCEAPFKIILLKASMRYHRLYNWVFRHHLIKSMNDGLQLPVNCIYH